MRAWIPFFLVGALLATLACSGKEEVEGTPVGSCTPGGQWSCTSFLADASGSYQQCPANVGAGVSCVISEPNGGAIFGGTRPLDPPGTTNAPGFQNVFTSDTLGPCFTCTSNGLGVVWNCTSQVWEAGDVFSCSP